jgi:hypothetical protein
MDYTLKTLEIKSRSYEKNQINLTSKKIPVNDFSYPMKNNFLMPT